MASEVTIVTAIHNIKSNKGSKTAGVDGAKMDRYLQMPKDELTQLIQSKFMDYKPKPARRVYIPKSNGKQRPLGIPIALDRIIQECVRIILEPICEARFYPHSYGFRPYRAQKHAIRDIVNVINASCKSPDQPVWAVEGDIKGCFDNIDHRLLLQKLWRIGVHDKRILKIISQMLKAGYVESDLYHATKSGTPQGGILSPLLSNVYLNDFDWYVGRTYMEPHRQCKHKCNDTRRLKWAGITPKYNFRFADDWVVLTSTEQEALRMKRELTKYFKHKMKLELSQEKTRITDLRGEGIHFLGFVVKAEKKRKTPDPATWSEHLVGKPTPDMERLAEKIRKRCKDEKLRGTVKEVVNQISHSKKWKSDIPLTDEKGNPLLRKNGKPMFRASYSILQDELFNYMTEQGFKGFQRGEYGSTAEHLTSLQYQIKQDKERLEKLQQRIQKEQVKYEPARHISKTLNEIDGMGQKTFTGKMAISKEDYSQLTALAKEGITSRAEIKSLEQNANYYRQKYFDSANALERMKTKYNELKEKCKPFLEALEHFPEVAKLFTEKVRQLFSFKEEQQRAEKEAREKERQERIKARRNKRDMER